MRKLTSSYQKNKERLDLALRVNESFDVLSKTLTLDGGNLTLYYIGNRYKKEEAGNTFLSRRDIRENT